MGALLGSVGISDLDTTRINAIGQTVVYDASMALIANFNDQLLVSRRIFVGGSSDVWSTKYLQAGGGYLQPRGQQSETAAERVGGDWKVERPLYDFGTQLAVDDVTAAYLTVGDWERQLRGVFNRGTNTYRHQMLLALLNNTARTFNDKLHGTLSITPLANGDSVLYDPIEGATAAATEDHYLVSGYTGANISDTNNPIVTIVNELVEHFGRETGGSEVVVFIHPDNEAKITALATFDEVMDSRLILSANVNVPTNLPDVPGVVIGRCNGAWVVVWRSVPTGYLIGVHLEADAPLYERIDPADTGLPTGLQLVATDMDYPFDMYHWRYRFGIGPANRLNGVVMQLKASGTYDIPTGYTV
jgi:hypothetical protein